jgi:hypothetical protein
MKLAALLVVAACSGTGPREPVGNQAQPPASDAMAVPKPGVDARIIKFASVGPDQIITVDKGSSDGVERRWIAKLVVDNGAQVIELLLVRVDKDTTTLKSMGPVPAKAPNVIVHLEPPPETGDE